MNNSGKSSILRMFWEFRNAFLQFRDLNKVKVASEQRWGTGGPKGAHDTEEVLSNLNDLDMEIGFALRSEGGADGDAATRVTLLIPRSDPSTVQLRWEIRGRPVPELNWAETAAIDPVTGVQADIEPFLQLFRALAESVYLGPFRNAINVGAANYYDLQIGSGFVEQWDQFKSGPSKRQNRAAVELTAELRRIFGLTTLELNAAPGNQNLQVIADGHSYRLDEQGAGLAQFVVVFAYVAIKRPSFVFIDEPELNLHPSLQLDFLTTLAAYTTHGVVFSTHSLGLARTVGNRVFSVRRVDPGRSVVRPFEETRSRAEFLGELSFSGYQELGYSRVLLVEGPTEVAALQRILRHYDAVHEVVLLPLGGSSLIHAGSVDALDEIRRLSDDVWVLIDSERRAPDAELDPPRASFLENCEKLGFTTHVLDHRAVENYFTDRAVRAALGEQYRALGPHERLADVASPWSKSENWRIAGELSREELDSTDLGRFLSELTEEPTQA